MVPLTTGGGDSTMTVSDASLNANNRSLTFAGITLQHCQLYRWGAVVESGAGCTASQQSPSFLVDIVAPILNLTTAVVYVSQTGNASAPATCVPIGSGGASVAVAITLRTEGFQDACTYIA